ncbi:MAG: glucosaminidase domain-containing protein [Candidatus Gracilibacteria bacterium]
MSVPDQINKPPVPDAKFIPSQIVSSGIEASKAANYLKTPDTTTDLAAVSTEVSSGVSDELDKNNPPKKLHKNYLDDIKKLDTASTKTDRQKFGETSTDQIKFTKVTDPKAETAKRMAIYTDELGNDWFKLNYIQVNNDHEQDIGLGDILLDPSITDILVKHANGQMEVGKRGRVRTGQYTGRLGFIREDGSYIATYTGEKFRILTDKELSKEEYAKKIEEENGYRSDYQKTYTAEMERYNVESKDVMDALRAEGYSGIPETPTGNKRKDFINTLTPIAKKVTEKFNNVIPWEGMLLQAGLESGWKLTAQTLFGIKSVGGQSSNNLATREVYNGKSVTEVASFRDFGGKTPGERLVNACIGYCELITKSSRYQPAINAYKNGGTPADYLREIAKAGYATDPNYYTALINTASSAGIDVNRKNIV